MQNVGTSDRVARAVAATAMVVTGLLAPLPLAGAALIVAMGVYLLGTSLVGSCVGYRLMGRSTCPAADHRARS